MTLTVFRAGNSQVVAIPRAILSDVGMRTGQKVVVEKSPDNSAIVIRKVSRATSKGTGKKSDREFEKWWRMFLLENGGILDDLA